MIIQVEFWHWWVLALCFVVIEGMIPSGVFIAMGIAASILGAIVMQYPHLEVSPQLGIFGTITMVLTLIFARYKRKQYQEEVRNGRIPANNMLGKELKLVLPIQNGFGEIEINGFHWSLKGPDTPKGTLVQVIQLDGEMLMVYPSSVINKMKKEQKEKEEKEMAEK